MDCAKDGWWYSGGCYFKADPTTDPSGFQYLPNWKPGGSVYMYYCLPASDAAFELTWLPQPPPGYGGGAVDPRVLAQRALGQMQLAKPVIQMAPQPPAMTYVGLETWLWMDRGQMEDLKLTVSAGPTSVTVTAAAVEAEWDFGAAGSTVCTSAGRPWVKGMTNAESTDCSHTFDEVSDFQPNGVFPVTATITYQVDWVCNGACLTPSGSLGTVTGPTSQDTVRVGERQSVVVR